MAGSQLCAIYYVVLLARVVVCHFACCRKAARRGERRVGALYVRILFNFFERALPVSIMSIQGHPATLTWLGAWVLLFWRLKEVLGVRKRVRRIVGRHARSFAPSQIHQSAFRILRQQDRPTLVLLLCSRAGLLFSDNNCGNLLASPSISHLLGPSDLAT